MKTIEQLAIESGAEVGTWDKSGNGQKLIAFTHSELTAFAEAYHKAKMEDSPVVGYRIEHINGGYELAFRETWQKVKKCTPLISKDGE